MYSLPTILPIYIFYIFTETAVYSPFYQSIMPAVSVTCTATSSTSTNVTNQRNRLESIPENGEIPDQETDESFLT
jgi:hypothetical protein